MSIIALVFGIFWLIGLIISFMTKWWMGLIVLLLPAIGQICGIIAGMVFVLTMGKTNLPQILWNKMKEE